VTAMTTLPLDANPLSVDTPTGTVYFCGPGCRDAYRDNPAAYV